MVLNLLQKTVSPPMSISSAAGQEKRKMKAQIWAQCSQGPHQLTRRGTAVLCVSGPLGHPMRFCCCMLNFFWFKQEERRMGTSSHERRHQRRFVLFEAPTILLCFKKLKCDCWRQEQGSSLKPGQQQAGASHFLSGKQGKGPSLPALSIACLHWLFEGDT